MNLRMNVFLVLICVLTLSHQAGAQNTERRATGSASQAQLQQANAQANASSVDTVASELGLLRKSLQTLNARLREISERLPAAPEAKQNDSSKDQQGRIALNLDLLSRAEQRAEVLRKQLLELIEKETSVRSRLAQLDEDMRPESIERVVGMSGSTRTPELREARRRVLENERKGYDSLLGQISQGRQRLEEDVKQADSLVARLRQRVLPLVEQEIDKLGSN